MIKRILVPTDFSTCANNTVKYAIQFAKKQGFEIIFFHSVFSEITNEKLVKSFPNEYKKLSSEAEDKIRKNVEKIYKSLNLKPDPKKISFAIRFDPSTVTAILKLVSKEKIDLIIMGTHGASGLRKVLFGSNTAHVISKSPVPVLSIPDRYLYHSLKELVYASDLQNVANELKKVKLLGKQLKTKISSVHFDYGWAKDATELKTTKLLERSNTNYKAQKVPLETPIIEPMQNYMKKKKDALLCMFHNSQQGVITKLFFGSNTEELSLAMKMPLLSVPKV